MQVQPILFKTKASQQKRTELRTELFDKFKKSQSHLEHIWKDATDLEEVEAAVLLELKKNQIEKGDDLHSLLETVKTGLMELGEFNFIYLNHTIS